MLPYVMSLQGGANFRDLGGYGTLDGRRVRRTTVFRSGRLDRLTAIDWVELGRLGLRTIVDFGSTNQGAVSPPHVEGLACKVVVAPFDPGAGKITGALADGPADPHLIVQLLIEVYRDFPNRCVPSFRTLFATLSDRHNRPLVFHCTWGKDRSGFAAALLLTLLGVPMENVVEDYLRTNDLMIGTEGWYPKLGIDVRAAIFEARASYIETALNRMHADFGSPESFADRALGLDSAALHRLKADLLE